MAHLDNTKSPMALGIPRDDSAGRTPSTTGDDGMLDAISRHQATDTAQDERPVDRFVIEMPSLKAVAILGGVLMAAISLLIMFRAAGEAGDRRIETELVQSRIAVATADQLAPLRVADPSIEASLVRRIMLDNSVGPRTAVFDIAADRSSYISAGATDFYALHPDDMAGFNLSQPGVSLFEKGAVANGTIGETMVTWRPMADGRAVVVLSPARDIFARTPPWITSSMILAVFLLIAGSMFLLVRRQSLAMGRASNALADARERLSAFEDLGGGSWSVDPKAGLVTLPASLMQKLGIGSKDRKLVLREVSGLIHPKDIRPVLSLWSGKSDSAQPMQFRMRSGTRGWIWVMTRLDTLSDPCHGIIVPLGENPVDNGRAAKLQARLTDAIESIPEAFLLWDDQGRLVTWNRKFCNIFRIQPTRLVAGQNIGLVADLAEEDKETVTEYFGPPADGREQSLEVRLPGNRWGHVSRRRTQEGGWVCVVTNITDMKRRARAQKRKERELEMTVETLEQSRSELREAMHNYQIEKKRAEDANLSKSEFLANMSHELRTPLNAINGFSEVMQSELYGPIGHAKYKEYIDDILGSGRHLLALIDDILDMSKIEAGRMELNPQPVDLERILGEGLRFVEPETRERDILLTSSINTLPSVWADNRATKQVFVNLLSNAVKFTEAGGSVTVTAQADLDSVTVLIADTGIGIARDRLQKLGEPFELIEDHLAKSRNGSGLGLALSKSLMELQSGLLVMASEKGRGTVAAFTIPRRAGVTVKVPEILRRHGHVLTRLPSPARAARVGAQERAAE
ncbi:PAS domain-containing sensor histidine kinase [Aquisalinus flavus]|uniref:histidine kinase n=1 Tax=Aquisalinus flavus TaxID=1526572 RepID=A0A8J2V1L8_9PROT|nr:PAS domain-containing sensor histidine kinase [Aquisalinus flavus]MBD0426307.1 PAS-domain containing protein [Aquisalinus flavus]UNE48125.1 PAS domain S-box protein [Aquisalinus flavus]GGD08976.1 hypothetical protein GCM10011342_17290 [Aquisalinus flavus]